MNLTGSSLRSGKWKWSSFRDIPLSPWVGRLVVSTLRAKAHERFSDIALSVLHMNWDMIVL